MSTQSISPVRRAPRRLSPRLAAAGLPLPVILAGTFMVVLDFFIVNVALPSMQARLHASNGAIEWVVAGYGLTNAVFLITGSRLGDRTDAGSGVRRRAGPVHARPPRAAGSPPRPRRWSSPGCCRAAAAALLMPNVLSIIGVLYDGADRAKALAAYGMVWALPRSSGQLIGGDPRRRPTRPGWAGAASSSSTSRSAWRPSRGAADHPGVPGARPGRLDLTGTILATLTSPRSSCRWSRAGRMAGRCGRGCRSPPRRCCSALRAPAAPARLARRHAAAAARAVRARGRSPPGWPRSWCSGAGRRRSSSCCRCTCSTAGA